MSLIRGVSAMEMLTLANPKKKTKKQKKKKDPDKRFVLETA
jgi:hypothetical protein